MYLSHHSIKRVPWFYKLVLNVNQPFLPILQIVKQKIIFEQFNVFKSKFARVSEILIQIQVYLLHSLINIHRHFIVPMYEKQNGGVYQITNSEKSKIPPHTFCPKPHSSNRKYHQTTCSSLKDGSQTSYAQSRIYILCQSASYY